MIEVGVVRNVERSTEAQNRTAVGGKRTDFWSIGIESWKCGQTIELFGCRSLSDRIIPREFLMISRWHGPT